MKKRTKIIIIVTFAIILISGITVAASKIWWGDNSGTVKADTIKSSPEENDNMLAETSENGEIKAGIIEKDKSAKDTEKGVDDASAKSKGIKEAVDSNVETAKDIVNKSGNDTTLKTDSNKTGTPAEKKSDDAGKTLSGEASAQQKAEVPTEKRTEAQVQQKAEEPTEKRTEAPVQQKAEAPVEKRTEAPVQQKTEAPAEKRTETIAQPKTEAPTEAPKCSHNWVWKTHTETIHHDAVTHEEQYLIGDAWDEAVYVTKVRCFVCGTYYDSTPDYHANDTCMGSYGHEDVIDHYIHHDAEYGTYTVTDKEAYDEIIEVKDYQYCSKCGESK